MPGPFSIDAPLERYLVQIDQSALTTPIRVVNDTDQVTSNGDDYLPFQFKIQLFSDAEREPPKSTITFNNVGRDLMDWLETSEGGIGATATIRVIRIDDPNNPIITVKMALRNLIATDTEITGELNFEDLVNRPSVSFRFDIINAPALF